MKMLIRCKANEPKRMIDEPDYAKTAEMTALRSRVQQLEAAIMKAIDFGNGHAWWDSEGNPKIESGGYTLLKETLEEK